MAQITTLFWDIGSVLLANSWDKGSRRKACDTSAIDREKFEGRHERLLRPSKKDNLGSIRTSSFERAFADSGPNVSSVKTEMTGTNAHLDAGPGSGRTHFARSCWRCQSAVTRATGNTRDALQIDVRWNSAVLAREWVLQVLGEETDQSSPRPG
jgi:hypothetical protein